MFNTFRIGARQALSGPDNFTIDMFRLLAAVSVAVGLGLQIYSVVTSKIFDIQNYGIGIGSLLGAAGLALRLKGEPEATATMTETKTTTITEKP